VLDCPSGTFQGAGVKTVVLFFDKPVLSCELVEQSKGGAATEKVWYYSLDVGRNMGKTNPLNDADLLDFVDLQKTFAESSKSWRVDVTGIDSKTYDLSVKNPAGGEVIVHRSPLEIMDEISGLDSDSADVLKTIKDLLNENNTDN
jgi:type I restriction enzyme M protein